MLSLESLFCDVDDFCQWFEPCWQRELLSNGIRRRRRCRKLCLSEIMTMGNCVPPIGIPEFQVVLHPVGRSLLAQSIPQISELQPLYRVDTFCAAAVVCLLAALFWQV